MNIDRLCRPCALEIMQFDADWYFNPSPTPRPVQLTLVIPRLKLPRVRPFGTARPRSDGNLHPPPWARAQRAVPPPEDDLRICPPTIPGQMALFEAQRELTEDHVKRISPRTFPEQGEVDRLIAEYAARYDYSSQWKRNVSGLARLALAAWLADGTALVEDSVISALPRMSGAVAQMLRDAGLLDPRCRKVPTISLPTPQDGYRRRRMKEKANSCLTCGAWGDRHACDSCRSWEKYWIREFGTCTRCALSNVPLSGGWCRACLIHVDINGPHSVAEPWVQLWLAIPGPRPASYREATDPPPVSPHRLHPGQGELFSAERVWEPALAAPQLPSMTPHDQELLAEFEQVMKERQWSEEVRSSARRSLQVLFSWLGTDAPIPEADVRALGRSPRRVFARRPLRLLADRGLLLPDPNRQTQPREHAVARMVEALPPGIREEVACWVRVMRGEGRRPHPARTYRTIGNYLSVLSPFLQDWSQRYTTLRQVTAEDIRDIIIQQDFGSAEKHMVAARRLFKALRQERVIFQDPTAGISIPKVLNPPVALPEDRLAGLLDRTDNLAFKTVIALVAVHGLSMHEVRLLRIDDVLLDRGRLLVHRTSRTRIIYLDELTADLINQWLRERHQRWPSSRNPYLIVSQVTAFEEGPVNALYYTPRFRKLGITASGLRQDRVLDEARTTADPVHLMQVFGICAATAMKYVNTAHPGRQSTIRL
ncbi:hypothetical protein NGM33_06630 [Nocardiopsis dassonvillei]|uniref:tyrosine-type recombinase/integrase n=1 Tax=Nocardiopsis dassonvillei TaxID=2014 RepID=UPI0020A4CBA2|nr:hypothetical protein [Nocardiopsis dassonvillei]MCP3013003.1 hypothetical protein [Nocardiopsis dassonvillei]